MFLMCCQQYYLCLYYSWLPAGPSIYAMRGGESEIPTALLSYEAAEEFLYHEPRWNRLTPELRYKLTHTCIWRLTIHISHHVARNTTPTIGSLLGDMQWRAWKNDPCTQPVMAMLHNCLLSTSLNPPQCELVTSMNTLTGTREPGDRF